MNKTHNRPEYTSVSLPKKYVDTIKEHIKNRKDLAYDSVAEYVRYAVRNQMLDDKGEKVDKERWEKIMDMMVKDFKDKINSIAIEYPFSWSVKKTDSDDVDDLDDVEKREAIESLIDSDVPPEVIKFFSDLAQKGYDFKVTKKMKKEE